MLVNQVMRSGDGFTVTELKRFGRNHREIYQEWYHITKELEMDIRVADNSILDTSSNKNLLGQVIADVVLKDCPMWQSRTGMNNMSCSDRDLKWLRQTESIWADPEKYIRITGLKITMGGKQGISLQLRQCVGWD